MNPSDSCPSEEILFGYATDLEEGRTVDADLSQHISACRHCQETVMESSAMGEKIASSFEQIKPPAVAENIAPFILESLLGEGGMGQVWKGRDTVLQRSVAIKILKPDTTHDDSLRARLLQEARSLSQLNHPNIVQLYQTIEKEEHLFLVMEYLEGKDLLQLSREKRLTLERALEIFKGVARALSRAHQQHILHRDIKPANVMILSDGHVKLLDFGLSKPLDQFSTNLTQTNMLMGTIRYMAPELLQGAKPSVASDIYALGAMFFDLLKNVYGLDFGSPQEFLETIGEEKTPVPSQWIALLEQMCRSRPQLRCESVEVVLGVLEATPPKEDEAVDEWLKREPIDQRLPKEAITKIIRRASQLKEERERTVGQQTMMDIGRELDMNTGDVRQAIEEQRITSNPSKSSKSWIIILTSLVVILILLAFLSTIRLGGQTSSEPRLPVAKPVVRTSPPPQVISQRAPPAPTSSSRSISRVAALPGAQVAFEEDFENQNGYLNDPWYGADLMANYSTAFGSKVCDGFVQSRPSRSHNIVNANIKPSYDHWNVLELDALFEHRSHGTIVSLRKGENKALAGWTQSSKTGKIHFEVDSYGRKSVFEKPFPTDSLIRLQVVVDPSKMRVCGRLIHGYQIEQTKWTPINSQDFSSISSILLQNDDRYWGKSVGRQIDNIQWVYSPSHSYDELISNNNSRPDPLNHKVHGKRELNQTTHYPVLQKAFALYDLDGNPNDSKNNLHASIRGDTSSVSNRFGFPNAAMHFLDASMLMPQKDAFDLGTENFSVSLWIKMKELESSQDNFGIVTNFSTGHSNQPTWGLFIQDKYNNQTPGLVHGGIDDGGFGLKKRIDDDEWHHLAMVRNVTGSSMKIYLDGELMDQKNTNVIVPYKNSRPVALGNHLNRKFSFSADELAFFHLALSDEEVNALANRQQYSTD